MGSRRLCCCKKSKKGVTCSTCNGIPETLTWSYRFIKTARPGIPCPDITGSETLAFDGLNTWGPTVVLPECPTCEDCEQSPSFRVNLKCNFVGGTLTLNFPDFGIDNSCAYEAIGFEPIGTFSCSPFLWAVSHGDIAGCFVQACFTCYTLDSWTLSA